MDQEENEKLAAEVKRLMVEDILDIRPLKLPNDAWKDHKKLTKFLQDVMLTVNRLIKGAQRQTKTTANELVARPTYAEEFANLRENVHKVIVHADV